MKVLKNPGFTLRYNAWLREVDRIRGDISRKDAVKLLFTNNPDRDWRSLFKWVECDKFANKYINDENRLESLDKLVELNQEMRLYE